MEVNFENGKLSSLYYHELFWLASSIVKKSEKLFDETKVPDSGYLIQVNPELHSVIASILSDAANIKKFIRTPPGKLNGESGAQARLRKERTKKLNDALGEIELKEILNHKVRNTLEHFDEYLDESNLKITKASKAPSPMAAYNMILSHWEAFSPRVFPVRLYISSERTFYNMKWSVNIGEMFVEAENIIKQLKNTPGLVKDDGPGGLMLRIDT
ncbi:MAG: hypothetical protein ACI88H_000475 [Cocleimonas sp.]|jgi:hypothetical protein